MAKILTVSRNSHHLIGILFMRIKASDIRI